MKQVSFFSKTEVQFWIGIGVLITPIAFGLGIINTKLDTIALTQIETKQEIKEDRLTQLNRWLQIEERLGNVIRDVAVLMDKRK